MAEGDLLVVVDEWVCRDDREILAGRSSLPVDQAELTRLALMTGMITRGEAREMMGLADP